ncbi:MAG: hypothetical protein J5601_00115 [Elusimicrobiaceae bacterium]|nr:hypothetical protein [Elusimicrobiaceae bacterium]
MKKGLIFLALWISFVPLMAQEGELLSTQQLPWQATVEEPSTTEDETSSILRKQSVSKSSLTATRADSKLNEKLLHKSVLNYTLPAEIETVVGKCVAGDVDGCYFSLKTYENHENLEVAAAANLELAVLSLQRGLVKQALNYIEKAGILSPEDPFIELTHGWILLCAGQHKQSREVFEHLLYLTADFEYVSSAKLGTALSFYFSGNKEKAAAAFQYVYTSNPYMISFVSYMLGRIASEMKVARHLAPVFLQQSLTHDEKNYAAAALYAKLSEKKKEKLQAWQYYATLFSLDPQQQSLSKKVEKYGKELGDKTNDYLFYLRLEQPIVHEIAAIPSELVRMALYANREQVPQEVQQLSVMGSGTVQVTDEKLGEVLRLPAYVEKIISFNPQTKGVDFKNAKGQVEFSSVRPVRIQTEATNKTLLVKNLQAANLFATDWSDKELKGTLIIIPTPTGIKLTNEVYAEDLIPALLATKVQNITQEAALQALAVVLRSALAFAVAQDPQASYHITDNDEQFSFKGINLMFKGLLDASQESAKIRLTEAVAGSYESCGVVTADTIENTEQKPNYLFSPSNVSKYMLSNPPADLYARPQDPTQWSSVKWIYLYEAKDIQQRIAYKQNIGHLRALTPIKLSPNGRILGMRFEGSKGSYETQDPQEVLFLLSAGTMRSNFFDILPFYKGNEIQSILVRGYDTGLGNGLCLRGAEGLAKKGADYMAIIKYYFPQARIINTTTGMIN